MNLFFAILIIAALTVLPPNQSGNSVGDRGLAIRAKLEFPSGMAIDDKGNLFIADRRANRVRRVDATTGIITTVAGNGERSFGGDGGPAKQSLLGIPEYVAVDSKNNLFIADRHNSRIRRVDAETGIITTVAGNGSVGYSGDGGIATEASLSYPFGVALDADGNIYIADTENHCIRRVDAKTKIITTVAGNGKQGFSGDGGPAKEATMYRPHNMAIDSEGNLVIGDSFNQRIRRVDRSTRVITTIAGTGEQGFGGDGGPALAAKFTYFGTLVYDTHGNLFITSLDNRIRRIDGRTNVITTIAGTGQRGGSGDGGTAINASMNTPYGMALDKQGNIYFADAGNGRVRRIDSKTGIITTIAGTGGQ